MHLVHALRKRGFVVTQPLEFERLTLEPLVPVLWVANAIAGLGLHAISLDQWDWTGRPVPQVANEIADQMQVARQSSGDPA